jgi:hypothetical protein
MTLRNKMLWQTDDPKDNLKSVIPVSAVFHVSTCALPLFTISVKEKHYMSKLIQIHICDNDF